ncbi:armadillo-type protein [Suillus discolor]|uniref:Armadillo-type protein n=1 Tax=Suillus discolor TaxID=1912936 RepID=A0A9P7JS40_9AGAM|nr:armadillo-type protein [Suillus discolor]KAG2104022.1 armadillo-type protein [Suillus discolor]
MVHTPSQGDPGHPMRGSGRTHSRRVMTRGSANQSPMSQLGRGSGVEPVAPLELSANRWVPASTARKGQSDVDSPELVDRKVKALLNKLTMEKFEMISDQIIHWANKSVNEKDGRTLIQVIRLIFEKAIDEAAWSEMYARLCRKMMEEISPEVQDDGVKNMEGKPIRGGHLFRKYLLNRCQEDFEHGWFAKDATTADFERAKRQGLNLITFIGELFKVRMLTERIMHNCVMKLLGNIENPEEEKIESLCQLLKTVGQLLDTPKARAHMDIYFMRMKELWKNNIVSTRMQFMLQDVIELRDRIWMDRDAAPATIAAVHWLAAKQIAAAEERQRSMSGSESRKSSDCTQEDPDGWAVAGETVPQALPEVEDLSPFSNITNVTCPSDISEAGTKDSKREGLSQTTPSSNMFHMFSQNPEVSTKLGDSSSRKTSVDLGHASVPEPAVQRRKLQLLPRSVHTTEENATTPLEEETETAPMAMSETDVKKKIDEEVKKFFAVHDLQEVELYFTNVPHELSFRLVDNRQIRMSLGRPRGGSEHNGPDSRAAPDGSVPWATPETVDLSQFGKITIGAPTVMSPKPSRSLGLKRNDHAGVPEPAAQRRKLQLLPRSVHTTPEHVTTPSKEPKRVPTAATVKKIDENAKEFFAVRNLQKADGYFPNIPDEHRFRLVDKLVASALKGKEADSRLVSDFFAQTMRNGQCTLEGFEKGFMPMTAVLDSIAIDAPRASAYMAIMLRGAGFQNEPERLRRVVSKLKDGDKLVSLVA